MKATSAPNDRWATTVALADVVEILDSQRVPINAKERAKRKGDVPYYGATGQVGWIDDHLFDEELVLLGEDGAPFLSSEKPKAYMIRGRSWVNNHAHVLRALGGIPNAFLMHQLNQVAYRPFVSGTTRLKLPQGPMRRIPLHIPPLNEQKRIVDAIETQFTRLDFAVETLHRIQANLKRYRASVLKAAVEGRLVPTEAELARQEGRDYEPASVLLERILKERRQKWEETELAKLKAKRNGPKDDEWKAKYKEPHKPDIRGLPPLPNGWCWTSLEQVVRDSLIGLVRSRQEQRHAAGGFPYVKMDNLSMNGQTELSRLVHVSASPEEVERFRLRPGDILFNTRNSVELVGKTGLVVNPPPDCLYNNNLMRLRTDGSILSRFVAIQMNATPFRERMEKVKRATTSVAAVYGKDLFPLPVALPPKAEQERIVAKADAMISIIEALDNAVSISSTRACRVRQSILKWAFEGKLVDQDPTDEPASVLLERIKAEREATPTKKPPARRGRPKKKVTR